MKVYAYSVEDYDYWTEQLGAPTRPGQFSENLTTSGVDLSGALVGEIWRVGTSLLQIAHVRIPCQTFKGWVGACGYDETAWVRRFTQAARPGPYLRVLEEGPLTTSPSPRCSAPSPRDRSLLSRLAAVEGLKPSIYEGVA